MTDRCPSCGASVRPGDPWCTLCWTDLRPAPPPPAPVPAPVAPTAPVVTTTPYAVDPLTAPLTTVLGEPEPAVDDEPVFVATWPCVECGAANALDRDACGVCTAPFGGRVARLPDPKEARRKMFVVALSVVAAFLVLLAGFTLAATPSPRGNDTPAELQLDGSGGG